MTDDEEQQKQIMEQRKELCTSQKAYTYSLNPDSLRTYVNAAGKLWNQTGTRNKIYLSSTTQFPNFNRFLNGCITTHRAAKATKKAASNQAETEILQDHELETLYENTTFSNIYQNKRYNQAILLRERGYWHNLTTMPQVPTPGVVYTLTRSPLVL
uniref:Uncharacterized protein n=1 Tax=Eutreptiella gymnastica TaxID=73025 RepID=A0A7S1I4C4_9EUGL